MWLLLRKIGASDWAGAFAGITFAFSAIAAMTRSVKSRGCDVRNRKETRGNRFASPSSNDAKSIAADDAL